MVDGGVVCWPDLYFFNNSEILDGDEDGAESESNPYFLSKREPPGGGVSVLVDGDVVGYFLIRSERLDVEEEGADSESKPYFFPKNDLVLGVVGVVCVSAYFFISSERLPVDGDGVAKPSSPYFL